MGKLASAVAVAVVLGFLLGRASFVADRNFDVPDRPRSVAPSVGSPSPTATPTPRAQRIILRYFATIEEDSLPTQGVLGGTMVAGTIAFPKGFQREPGDIFYVVGSDGHLLETWTYEVTANGSWKHSGTKQGYVPRDLEDRPARYDAYLWRPAHYIPIGSDGT